MITTGTLRIETPVNKKRKIHLTENDPATVWNEILTKDHSQINEFYLEMKQHLSKKVPWWIISTLAKRYYRDITQQNKRYVKECEFFADHFGLLTREEMLFLQVQTTIANYFPGGCTTIAMFDEQLESMICMRSLDWGAADQLAKITRLYEIIGKNKTTLGKVAGIAGMVGILTAVKVGFAVVGNYAPRTLDKNLHDCLQKDDASFLIRQLIENDSISTYQQAVETVLSWDVGAPFFITICGVSRGEACTIEFGGTGQPVPRFAGEDSIIIQTNHYPSTSVYAPKNRKQYSSNKYSSPERWYCSKLLKNSSKRLEITKEWLQNQLNTQDTLKKNLQNLFRISPVLNYESAHWAYMQPATLTMEITTLVDNDTCFKSCNFFNRLFCRK